ncbi:MAG: WecB/TagA/CpsF family glycosyltransferase [Bacteroidaceae bacterium]|nr:WecB/TagA/CpsF family glycosyltransferase [Bacteroidaceae bacterium]
MKSILTKKIIDTETKPFELILNDKGKIYTFLNPVSYLEALKNKELFKQFDGIYADGSILATAINIMYGEKVTRRSFDMTWVAPKLMEHVQKEHKTLYIIGSQQKSVEKAVDVFKKMYEGINIIGYRNGYLVSEEEKDEEAKNIAKLNPDFVIVGMGIITQEDFLIKVMNAGYQGIGFTCGGFIHQTAMNEIHYYPKWINRMNIRFLYRMWKEPHTRIRYIKAGIIFPTRFMWEKFFG